MSGHSKWSKVKHQKATTDAAKAQAFTKATRAITIAVKEGGGITDPEKNFRLRLAIEKAHGVNMPKENIDRAIAKGAGGSAEAIEQVAYEGYGPGGVALLIEAATDNRARTVSAIKNILERSGATLASPGAVSYLFSRAGVLTVHKARYSVDDLLSVAVEAGADDVVEQEDLFEVFCNTTNLEAVKQRLEGRGMTIDNAAMIMKPTLTVSLSPDAGERINALVNQLEELEDVQHVYTNLS